MPDATTPIDDLKAQVRRFGDERQWQPFHTPKNLAMGLAVETAELMEHFLWVDGPRSRELGFDPARREAIADEVADVFLLCAESLQCAPAGFEFGTGAEVGEERAQVSGGDVSRPI